MDRRLSMSEILRHLDQLTKPPGSLGKLEALAARLCFIQQTLKPPTAPRRVVIFAADHGVVQAGVTMWPSAVTGLMVRNMFAGGAASTVMARQLHASVVLVNVGCATEPEIEASSNSPITYHHLPVDLGTRNLAVEPAMSVAEFDQAWAIGEEQARVASRDGMKLVVAGEMGIGNTTPSACLAMLLGGVDLYDAVGRGAGADDATLQRKREIVQQAVNRAVADWSIDPKRAIAAVAGFELVAIAGFYVESHRQQLTVVLDGYVSGAAALIAQHFHPDVTQSLIAGHLSAEPGHRHVLTKLGLEPFLEWDMRLGEGSGALAVLPLLDLAAAITCEMATFADLGIGKADSP